MTDARAAILARLDAAPVLPPPALPAWMPPPPAAGTRIERFRKAAEAWRAEVHEVGADWPAALAERVAAIDGRPVLYAPATPVGARLAAGWPGGAPPLVAYDRPVEEFKASLLNGVGVGVTAARAAVAETGTLVSWPSGDEPRLLSLLPPVHVAVLRASDIRDTLAEVIAEQAWASAMPTNALLISGPSKTADIEQTLAFGVHGPKRLVVLLLREE
jgi:L-lactate dehydrogenase complex protein LldG